jgi:predicted metal-dependent phosphotriesterase family hydrolase
MATVNSVLGPLDTADLGFTLTHEHVFLSMWADDGHTSMAQLNDEEVLAAELTAFREAGGERLLGR